MKQQARLLGMIHQAWKTFLQTICMHTLQLRWTGDQSHVTAAGLTEGGEQDGGTDVTPWRSCGKGARHRSEGGDHPERPLPGRE